MPAPRLPKLSPDGRYRDVLATAPNDRERYDLWAIDTADRQWRMLVDSRRSAAATMSEAEKMQRERARVGGSRASSTYDWSPDGKSILVPLDGDLYLAASRRRGPAADQHAGRPRSTPTSREGGQVSVSFVRDQNSM